MFDLIKSAKWQESCKSSTYKQIWVQACWQLVNTSIHTYIYIWYMYTSVHQTFQVPKMEVLSLIRLFLRWLFPYISRIHTAYIGEYLHFRYLKCLVISIIPQYIWIPPSNLSDFSDTSPLGWWVPMYEVSSFRAHEPLAIGWRCLEGDDSEQVALVSKQ